MIIFKVKNFFKKPCKKTFGKLGLFLVFSFVFFSFSLNSNYALSENKAYAENLMQTTNCTGEFGCEVEEGEGDRQENLGLQDGIAKDLLSAFNWLLFYVSKAIAFLVNVSGSLLDKVLEVRNVRDTLSNDENVRLYAVWTVIRDFINLFFMLALLFSAFATIFQVEKYHLKKMIVLFVVMALLVNFSYPITLFIIDFSNSMMYYFIGLVGQGNDSSYSGELANISNLGLVEEKILNKTEWGTTVQIILSIIFLFILFVTFFAYAINLLIRIYALAILLMLSPAGLALAFFPDTKNISSSWWSNLFKYAFMGPIMVFFLYLAFALFEPTGRADYSDEISVAKALRTFIYPIVFLWFGLIISQKFGGMASGAAMSVAKNTGDKIKGYAQKGAWGATKVGGRLADDATMNVASGSAAAIKLGWNKLGDDYNARRNRRATAIAAGAGMSSANEKLVTDTRKKWKDGGVSDAELDKLEEHGTAAEKSAVALERAENGRFSGDVNIAYRQYQNGLRAVQGNDVHSRKFADNVGKKNVDLVVRGRVDSEGAAGNVAQIQNIAREEFEKLNPDQWADQNIQRMTDGATPNRNHIIAEGANVISNYSQQGRDNVTRNMKGAKRQAGSQAANGGQGFWA